MSTQQVLVFLYARTEGATAGELNSLVPHGSDKARRLVLQGYASSPRRGFYELSERGLEAAAAMCRGTA